MRRFLVSAIGLALLGVAAAVAGVGSEQQAARAKGLAALTPVQQRLVSGFARRALDQRSAAAPLSRSAGGENRRTSLSGCPVNRGSNIRVNQECLNQADPDLQGRSQAQNETAIAQDPSNPSRIVASSNDYRRGDSGCYVYYSSDGGRTWRDSTEPVGFTRGTAFGDTARQYWQASGDPALAWDTKGNAYQSCLTFMRGPGVTQNPDSSSAFYVFRSTGTGGASWNFPGRPVAEFNDPEGEGTTLLDKEYLTVDNHRGSRFQDRLYVTWTLFAADGTAYIYGAFSRDYGESFSSPRLVSRTSALCSNTQGAPTPQGSCNINQFSQPFTAPDGTLYVVWDNYNVTAMRPGEEDEGEGGARANGAPAGIDNRAQVLLAKSTDGGNSFSAPVKVADYYELPDCETYQEASEGVSCVPEKGETHNSIFRASNYPVGSVNPRDPREVQVTLASYINRHSNERNGCVPQGTNPDTLLPLYDGVKEAGACNNDVLVSRSRDRGRTFTGGSTDVRRLPAVRNDDPRADQFWQWSAFDPQGRLAVSYYDRAYGDDERTGFSDISLSGGRNGADFATTRVTTGSMPPPSQFDGGFYGDYSALSAEDTAHPAWMDTRDPNLFVCRDSAGEVTLPPSLCTAPAPNADVANDQNVYTRSLATPTP
jgi:hypothetical protein